MLANASPKDERRDSMLYSGPTQPIPKKSLQIRTDKPRPHVCTICTRAFARLEHLKRHERSHTNEKPYQCAACGRCFARRDLVLRHQQKLHLHNLPGVRRGLVPPAAVSETSPPPGSDNIIFLQHNTNAKAPLPNGQRMGSWSNGASNLAALSLSASPHDHTDKVGAFGYLLMVPGSMPLPKTSSSQNTPSAALGRITVRPSSADLDPSGASASAPGLYTQQPSPLTGDSPDLKKKKKYNWSSLVADDMHQVSTHRHASFLAVLGASYTNLKDALSIQSHQIADAPTQVGFSTPQFTATELDAKGLLALDFGSLDMDWYNLDFDSKQDSERASLPRTKSSARFAVSENGARKLTTIPSETQLKDLDLNYFSNDVMASHQFHDPSHPHHIKGSTPMEFNFDDGTVTPIENKRNHTGTGFMDFAGDLFAITGNPNQSPQPSMGLASASSASGVSAAMPPHQMFQGTASPTLSHSSAQGSSVARRIPRRPSPAKRSSMSSVSLTSDFKRAKLGFVNVAADLDWVKEIQDVPVLNELSASHDTGFLGMPYIADQFEPDEILNMFKCRQDDLVKQRSQVDTRLSPGGSERLSVSLSRNPARVLFTIGDRPSFVTDELRNKMILECNINSDNFPPLDDLNSYMNLYEREFNKYFPFIHMPSLRIPMVDNFENIPLILAMCSLGALYSYHDNNSLLLFNLSKYRIHSFFENEITAEKLSMKKVPIMAHQSLVLHIFISMFLNEPNMVDTTSRQIRSMVGLIKATNFQNPLEQYLVPPPSIKNPNDVKLIQENFDYFIMAQTRIRTIHTFYLLEVIRNTLLGLSVPMKGVELLSGTQCGNDVLWDSANASEWFEEYQKCGMPNLVELANNETLEGLLSHIYDQSFPQSSMSIQKSLTMLVAIHEQILHEINTNNLDSAGGILNWRIDTRPKMENLISAWERFFHRSGGFNVVNDQNRLILKNNGELTMILPLLAFAKLRLCVNVTPFMRPVVYKDWKSMEEQLTNLEEDVDGLKDAVEHALYILNLWAQNISMVNNPKKTSVRTPVYFVTCICIAVMVVSKALNVIENLATLSIYDKALWLNTERVLRTIEATLTPSEDSYAEFLHKQSHGIFDYVWTDDFKTNVDAVMEALNSGDENSASHIKKCKLLVQALSLGVRMLADAPLWPLAMGFAEGLKNMATQIFGKDTK